MFIPTLTNAFVIDPKAKTVEAVYTDLNDYKEIYKHIQAGTFDAVRVMLVAGNKPIEVTCWVDDEGALIDDHVCFEIGFRPEERILLAGRALVTGGPDREGETTAAPATLTLDILKAQVGWTQSQISPGFILRDMTTGRIL